MIDAALPKDKIVELLPDHPSGTADVQAASVFDRLRADLSKNGTEAANQASNSALGQQSISVFNVLRSLELLPLIGWCGPKSRDRMGLGPWAAPPAHAVYCLVTPAETATIKSDVYIAKNIGISRGIAKEMCRHQRTR